MRNRIAIFTRYPEAGKAKTRLIPLLSEQGAADLHRALTEKTLDTVREAATSDTEIEIRYTGASTARMAGWLGDDLYLTDQGPGDLGARMRRTFAEAFTVGATACVIVGSDIPSLRPRHITTAITALRDNDLVLGPAKDGGYYLIGLRQVQHVLFDGPAWGQHSVLAQTLAIAMQTGLSVFQLEMLEDVDRPEDVLPR